MFVTNYRGHVVEEPSHHLDRPEQSRLHSIACVLAWRIRDGRFRHEVECSISGTGDELDQPCAECAQWLTKSRLINNLLDEGAAIDKTSFHRDVEDPAF